MNLIFRYFIHILHACFRVRLDIADESRVALRVLPTDLDFNGHMNNGRFLSLMDIGRLDLVVRCGLAKACLRRGWRPMVAAITIRFRKGLGAFQKIAILTRVIGWDDGFAYLEQKFVSQGKVVAMAVVKGNFVAKTGPVASKIVQQAIGSRSSAPELPSYVLKWQQADQLMKESLAGR